MLCNCAHAFYIGRHDIEHLEGASLTLEMSSSVSFDRSTVIAMAWGGRHQEQRISFLL